MPTPLAVLLFAAILGFALYLWVDARARQRASLRRARYEARMRYLRAGIREVKAAERQL